ncbi:CYTH domain-containing protein [Dethiosulfovibrio salsuginis]|uniref:CYTH domain-containing protein n=1 Tax=Dethiosulfovibrio salsuginis TaxID=561720 RepID=A0A1X7KUZ0_9BACT|nr:hypothetical protein [Dethiosulfovibrio salsuginis]SMG45244.1 CYTH domain-containing protein [Dethiosulfovibrio salsuginis]
MGTEIERKYLCKVVGNSTGRALKVDQRYLIATKAWETRVRSIDDRCYITVKTGSGFVRGEWELPIPRWIFRLLGSLAPWRIEKARYRTGPWEVDIYPDLPGFAVAEVELASQLVQVPKIPEWLEILEDITLDSRWKNKEIARKGLPEISRDMERSGRVENGTNAE